MSEIFDLNAVLHYLDSEDSSEQALALDEATAMIIAFSRRVVDSFVHSHNRLPIAERLYHFGSIMIEPLKELLLQTEDAELRVLTSLVLLQLGSQAGVSYLLEAISTSDEYLCMVANRLAEANILEAGDRMIKRLRALEMNQIDYIVCLLSALQKLDIDLPQDLYERFTATDIPFQIRMTLKKHQ